MLRFFKNLCFKTQTNKPIFIRKDYQNNPSKLNNNEDLVVTYNNVSKATYNKKPNQNLVIPNQCIVDAANIASCITNPLLPFILKHLTDYCFKSLNKANNDNAFNSVNDNIDIDIDIDNNTNNINNDIDNRYLLYYKYLNLNCANQPPVIDAKFNNYTPKFSFNNDKITIPENLSQYIAYRIYFKFYKNLWLIKDDNNIGQYFLQFKTENCTIDFKDILKTITLYDLVPFVVETILDKINSTNVIIILHRYSNINDKHINDDCVFTYCECLKKLNINNFNTVKPSCNHSLRVHFNFGNFYKNIENIQNININKIQIMQSTFIDDDYTIIEHSNFFAFVDNENNNSDHTNIKCYRPNPARPIENDRTKTFNKYLYGYPVLSNLYEYGILTNKLATHIPLSPLCPIIISNDNYNNQPEPKNCTNINKINICKYDIQFDKKKTLHIKPIINNLIHLVMKLYNNYMQHFNFLSQFYFCSYINSSNVVNDQLYYVDPSKSDQTRPPLLPQSKPPTKPQQFQNNTHNNNQNPSAPQYPAPIYINNRNRSHSPKLKYMNKFQNNQYDNVYLEPTNSSSPNSSSSNPSPPAYTHINQNNIYDEINQQNNIDIEQFSQSSHLLSNNRNSRYNKKRPVTRNPTSNDKSNND